MALPVAKTGKQAAINMRKLFERMDEEIRWELDKIAKEVYKDSQKIVPVDTGALRKSGAWEPSVKIGGHRVATVSYETEYAVEVHENLTNYHEPPTKAKFLEEPTNVARRTLPNRIKKAMQRGLK